MSKLCIQICLLVFTTFFSSCAMEDPVVKTPVGIIKGRHIKSYEGRTVSAFEGIPYAKPPVGELRFKEPQPADSWSDTLYANQTYVCLQYTYLSLRKNATGDENCLYLYVYVPREKINESDKLDVVVHIHGGGFFIGDPTSFAGPDYIMDRELIYVNMNYRLGILGFLSTEDNTVPGNNGLKDQVLAFKWIKDNIQYFGGNSDSITLTGMSAGASSVHYHYLSPLSRGLFHRGHSLSGTALSPWALTKNPLGNAQKLGKMFNCSTDTSKELIKCLRTIPGKDLTIATGNFLIYNRVLPPNCFTPVIEPNLTNAFLVEHPYKLLMEGRFYDVPWIASNTKDEGIVPAGYFVLFRKFKELDERWNDILSYSLVYYDTVDEKDKPLVANAMKKMYFDNHSLSMDNALDLIKLHTERLFLTDSENAIRLQAKMGSSPIYYYFYDYHIHIKVALKANLPVVGHGDDYALMYHYHRNPKVFQEEDNEMSKLLLDFLFSFANEGLPRFKNVKWKPISPLSEDIDYLYISFPNDTHVKQTKEIGSTLFWNSLPFKENAHLFT